MWICCYCKSLAEQLWRVPLIESAVTWHQRLSLHMAPARLRLLRLLPAAAAGRKASTHSPLSGSDLTYCSTISLRVTIRRAVSTIINSPVQPEQMARPERQGRGIQWNPLNKGSRPAAGALEDNSCLFTWYSQDPLVCEWRQMKL